MQDQEQVDALYEELEKVIYRFSQEFDLKGSDVVWVLELLKKEAVDVSLDFQSEFWECNDDEEGGELENDGAF